MAGSSSTRRILAVARADGRERGACIMRVSQWQRSKKLFLHQSCHARRQTARILLRSDYVTRKVAAVVAGGRDRLGMEKFGKHGGKTLVNRLDPAAMYFHERDQAFIRF